MNTGRIMDILRDAKRLAQEYRAITGKPPGITGEVAEYEAARLLHLQLTSARQAGYDATEQVDGKTRRLQIKGRCLLQHVKKGQRVGSIDIEKDFDAVLVVLLDHQFDAFEIFEAEREAVFAALIAPGSRGATNEALWGEQVQSNRPTTLETCRVGSHRRSSRYRRLAPSRQRT
jgi:hypothetical protein